MSDYVNLRVFSHYSRFDSILKPGDIINFAKKHSLPYIGICDQMNLFGAVEFSKAAEKQKIKPIIGCIIRVDAYGEIPVFIKDERGFKQLSETISKVYIQERSSLYIDELLQLTGVVVLSGSLKDPNKLIELYKTFSNDFFLELQEYSGEILELAISEEIPVVFTSKVRYEYKEDVETFEVFQSIDKKNQKSKTEYMKAITDFPEAMQLIQEGFENTVNIAKKCNFIIRSHAPMIPKYSNTTEEDDNKIGIAVEEGLKRKLELNYVPEVYQERLNYELRVIKQKGFSGYFLVTSDFIRFAKGNNIPVGPGRGSGAGCLTAYALDITDIDPIEFNLIFERFLNPERMSMPDFDIDFCPFRREEVVKYLANKYGPYNVVNIITFGTLQTRAVLKDVARVFHVGYGQINSIIKYIPNQPSRPIKLYEALEIVPQLKSLAKEEKFEKIFHHAKKLEGLMRNFSQHAAGIIIMDQPVYKVCPLFREEGLVTQFNLADSEYVGCVKFDLLGLKTLTIIQKTIELIKTHYGKEIIESKIDLKDRKTYDLFRSSNVEGVFQFDGSAGIKESLAKLKPDNIEDLIAMNALYRPGPIHRLNNYIKRKFGQEEITYLHESVKPILEPTFGIIVYQEQVMDIARICANYTLGQADLLRRAMGKKKPEAMKKQKEFFIDGCIKGDIDRPIAEQLFEEMSEFAGYGFNKSHSAPYSVIAYRCAYLKANYPKEFLSTCMSYDHADGDKLARYFYSMKQMGIDLLPPCVTKSSPEFTVEADSVRFGLLTLKNISEETAHTIKINTPYKDIYDFVNKNKAVLNKKTWDSLVYSCSLDVFSVSKEILINNFTTIQKYEELPVHYEPWAIDYKYEQAFKYIGFHIKSPANFWHVQISGCKYFEDLSSNPELVVVDILDIKKRRTVRDDLYAFIQICDGQELIDATVFPTLWVKKAEVLEQNKLLVLSCKKQSGKLYITDIKTLDEVLEKPHTLKLKVNKKTEVKNIKTLTELYKGGNCHIQFQIGRNIENSDIYVHDSVQFRNELTKNHIPIGL